MTTAPDSVPNLSRDHLAWPFFDESHAVFAARIDAFAASPAMTVIDHHDVDTTCRALVRALGEAGLLDAAVSVTNGCGYCIASHTAAARKAGMTEEMFGEVMAVTGMANETNRLANGYRVPIDPMFE